MNDADIAGRWAKQDIFSLIMSSAKAAAVPVESLTQETLAPLDHFHARGLASTVDLADRIPVETGHLLLDMGCGLGGPARYFAKRFGCRVFGIDVTPQFVECANKLTALVGLSDQVVVQRGDALELPWRVGTFDGVYSQHVTMNIQDRGRFFGEAMRVLKPGGYFALSEHGLGDRGDPHFPLPWSEDGSGSYLVSPERTVESLNAAGFANIVIEETGAKYLAFYRKAMELQKQGNLPPLGVHLLMGPGASQKIANSALNIGESRTRPILVTARKPTARPERMS